MSRRSLFTSTALSLLLLACGGNQGQGDGDGGAGGSGGDGGNGEFGDIDASPGLEACKKIDLVFAVDPSGSMSEELASMSNEVFPAFATALRDVGGGL